MLKRVFDTGTALFLCVFLAPLLAVVALVVKLSSPGPVLFRQERMGRGFRPFSLLKFRTMRVGGDGPQVTADDDPRITAVGKILRASKLDELPQLINIVRGDMSFVGPRPEVPKFARHHEADFREILRVRPGLTDESTLHFLDESARLAASSDPEALYVREILPEKIALAKRYASRAGFLFDLTLILRTLGTLVRNAGAPDADDAPSRWRAWAIDFRRPIVLAVHGGAVAFSSYAAFFLRFDGEIPAAHQAIFWSTLPWLLLIRGASFIPFHLYQGMWRYAGVWDLRNILCSVLLSSLVFFGWVHGFLGMTAYPRSVMTIDAVLLILVLGGLRLTRRVLRGARAGAARRRVLIVGAGDAGESIVRQLRDSPTSIDVVGFLDDDPAKQHQRIHGIPVVGGVESLREAVDRIVPDEVVVAIHQAPHDLVRQIVRELEPYAIPIKTFPGVSALVGHGDDQLANLRPLCVEDLLPRAPVGRELEPVRSMVEGRRVLVTGAGGSIGSELCRQIASLEPSALILFERYENSLYEISSELIDRGFGAHVNAVIGDINDSERLEETFRHFQPHIVIHAAAHKHVPLMEANPGEALKNNVLGTRAVAQASERHQVERFVLISTDKAVYPSSVMGATKRLAELVVQSMATQASTQFMTVRFGNVLGSNGSVVHRFQEQIQTGGPVTVTHPAMERYFMLIPEAVELVLQAAAQGQPNATYVLEMGEPVKLVDLARNVIRLSGAIPNRDVDITFVGLRPGEKLYEDLIMDEEVRSMSPIDQIHQVKPFASIDLVALERTLQELESAGVPRDPTDAIEFIEGLLPEYAKRPALAQPPR